MADILLNVWQAKHLFSTVFVGTNSNCDAIDVASIYDIAKKLAVQVYDKWQKLSKTVVA